MNCPNCGAANRESAKFCKECGNALTTTITCPNCGASNSVEQKFCDSCGNQLGEDAQAVPGREPAAYIPPHLAEKILRERTAIEGERRTVTVLFADAAGFTPLSEKLSEEHVYALMQGCVQKMMDARGCPRCCRLRPGLYSGRP